MQIKFFRVPAFNPAEAEAEVNAFLRGNRILQIDRHFESLPGGGAWVICVEYLPNMAPGKRKSRDGKKPKVDYKEELAPEVFKRFEALRRIRKELAEAEGLPAYAVFTDKELSAIAGLSPLNIKAIQEIEGIGNKKTKRFGQPLIDALLNPESQRDDETVQ